MREGTDGRRQVVCVHGAGGGGWEWAIWARVLGARGFGVFAPDLLPAARGLATTRFEDYRAQVLEWCRGMSEAPVLVGASLGGLLALTVVRDVSASALVLVNPLQPSGLVDSLPSPTVVPWRSRRTLASTRRAMPDADDAARIHAFRRWRDESGAVLDEARAGVAIEAPGCPVLVFASEHDTDVPAESSCLLAATLEADFDQVAGASHVGPLLGRSAARTAERVADWLAHRAMARSEENRGSAQCVVGGP
jgi:pimeloyl-ACP methyl ester carboxylesterase